MIASGEPLDDDLFTFLLHHVVVPAAVIAMVASLLSYLVDVRSAFLGGGPQLKWIGFCFAAATVLIERYGHTQGDRELQGCYTIALSVATILVMMIEPWETRPVGLGEKAANLLIIAAVWHLARGVTRGLSPEEGRPAVQTLRLFGLDRLRAEAWQRKKEEQTGAEPPEEKKVPAIPANPAMSVARLAAFALLAFAVGEPVLLGATPQTGIRALAAVVVFLFATGVVLAAGSGLDALRRAEWAGGMVSPGWSRPCGHRRSAPRRGAGRRPGRARPPVPGLRPAPAADGPWRGRGGGPRLPAGGSGGQDLAAASSRRAGPAGTGVPCREISRGTPTPRAVRRRSRDRPPA